MMRMVTVMAAGTILASAVACFAVPSIVEEAADGVYVVRDDTGMAWGGWSMGVSHMNSAKYQAKKILDLSDVPADVWDRVREVRLSAYLMVRDYSGTQNPPVNGLDESFEVVVNGTVHSYPTSGGGMPVWRDNVANYPDWYDFVLPKDQFVRGPNEIIFRKAPSDKNDDFLYLGIDNCEPRGNSSVSFDGETWTQDKLTIPGGNGEYMVRLYLIERDLTMTARWRPGAPQPLDDPAGLILYAGAHGAEITGRGAELAAGQSARVEWRPEALDRLAPATALVSARGNVQFAWLDEAGVPGEAVAASGTFAQELPAERQEAVSGLVLTADGGPATIEAVTVTATLSYHPSPEAIDIAPVVTPVPPPPPPGPPTCTRQGDTAILRNGWLQARFELGERLHLASLRHELANVEMARSPEDIALFVVEVGDQRYAGSRDFRLTGIEDTENGFVAQLALDEPALAAALTATIDDEGLRLGLELSNAGGAPVDVKLAFPHLAGLALSADPAEDYYFFPYGGGIIADQPAILRGGYGDHQVLYQVMDLYSPAIGYGLSLRVDDDEGWHKNFELRKHLPGRAEQVPHQFIAQVRPEYQWATTPLGPVTGTGMAVGYLRRTRAPGESFAPEPAVLAAHPGDWHVAMRRYADWAHRVWQFRPYPSRLSGVRNMIAAGWATGYLFRDGAYRTDIIRPRTDCVELMSWWDWSELGPFSTPMDRLEEVMTPAEIERWRPYMVDDPVTGRRMWNNQPGDYRGYNERFGGLPAFRRAIETYRELGAKLVTLYTDPFRLDDNCETGRAHGREWGVVGVDGEKTKAYLVWNPCHDLPAVREWIATELGRVMRETGADGIRLDEYGHRGWACYDETHQHTYAEPGITQWQKAVSEATRMIHAAMDEVRPDLVLTTEHPGYDFLMQHLEGCITYDLTGMASAMRPLECNIQRFYFRECKPYELDHHSADPQDRKKFWNAVESFGRYYPPAYYTILSENEATYWLGEAEPLLVTPGAAAQVYVNRFTGAGKTIYHLFNATGHTFEGEALAVPLADGEHLFDLLACAEIEPLDRADGLAGVSLYLPRGEVGCVIALHRRLTVSRNGNALQVTADLPEGECSLVVANAQGDVLIQAPAQARMTIDLTQAPEGSTPACVKLLRGGALVDVAEL